MISVLNKKFNQKKTVRFVKQNAKKKLGFNFVKKKSFLSQNKGFIPDICILTLLKSSAFDVSTYQSEMFHKQTFCKAKWKETQSKDQLLCFLQSRKTLILTSKTQSRQFIRVSSFSKNHKRLEDRTFFFDQKSLKLFTFLPFETPNILFLPKMGVVLFYSSSFSMINYA